MEAQSTNAEERIEGGGVKTRGGAGLPSGTQANPVPSHQQVCVGRGLVWFVIIFC